mmetsp:Transcript_29236/g.86567  ORF Transcript_29236/g.86567 Transcript_29236/m.86567 type:complete len:233 (+) Transcript_29236:139-837(+)
MTKTRPDEPSESAFCYTKHYGLVFLTEEKYGGDWCVHVCESRNEVVVKSGAVLLARRDGVRESREGPERLHPQHLPLVQYPHVVIVLRVAPPVRLAGISAAVVGLVATTAEKLIHDLRPPHRPAVQEPPRSAEDSQLDGQYIIGGDLEVQQRSSVAATANLLHGGCFASHRHPHPSRDRREVIPEVPRDEPLVLPPRPVVVLVLLPVRLDVIEDVRATPRLQRVHLVQQRGC